MQAKCIMLLILEAVAMFAVYTSYTLRWRFVAPSAPDLANNFS